MRNLVIRYKLEVIGAVAGAMLGWLYWYKIGCASGTCAITSSPINSTLYGGLVGGIFLSLFNNRKIKQEKKETK